MTPRQSASIYVWPWEIAHVVVVFKACHVYELKVGGKKDLKVIGIPSTNSQLDSKPLVESSKLIRCDSFAIPRSEGPLFHELSGCNELETNGRSAALSFSSMSRPSRWLQRCFEHVHYNPVHELFPDKAPTKSTTELWPPLAEEAPDDAVWA
ncbi:hypothetical protein Ae201684P_017731 [Aphanomyces euteiches]|nr:hypothetical protein Ae201684P_017731 [Aphanomyces euteiches]